MKVRIDRDRDTGWHFGAEGMKSDPFPSYPDAKRHALAAGHELDNAGWSHRMLMWNWHQHAMDGYLGWEIENPTEASKYDRHPAFVKLTHVHGKKEVESHVLAAAWDDVATVDFYQRDWTDDGLPTVSNGDTYWSGWWFATVAERDRFVEWQRKGR